MLVEDVQGAGFDLVDLAVGNGFDLAIAAHAVHRLQVVLVVDVRLGVGIDGGDMEREAHIVVLEQHAGAVPGFGDNLAVGLLAFGEGAYDHYSIPHKTWCGPVHGRAVRQPCGSPDLRSDLTGLFAGLAGHHGSERLVQNAHGLVDLLFADHQRAETLDHFAVGTAGFDHQAVLEGVAANGGGDVAIRAADADHHAAAFDEQRVGAIAAYDLVHAVGDALALGAHALGEAVVLPEMLQRRSGGDEGVVVAAEGAVVLARLPLVQLLAQQHHGERQAEAR